MRSLHGIVVISLMFVGIFAHADFKNIQEGLKPVSVVNARMARAYPTLTALQDSVMYTYGSFSDPDYDPLISPAFFSELSDAIVEMAQDGNGPMIRQAMGIILYKLNKFIIALNLEKDKVGGIKMPEQDRRMLLDVYTQQFTSIAELLINNVASIDPDYFKKHQDDFQNAQNRFASGDKRIIQGEYFSLTDSSGWWSSPQQRLGSTAALSGAPSKLALLVTAVFSTSTTKGQSRALRPGLYATARNPSESTSNRTLALYSLIQFGGNDSTLLSTALSFIGKDKSDTIFPNFYTDLSRRALNRGLVQRRDQRVEQLVSNLAKEVRKNKSRLEDLFSIPATQNMKCVILLGGDSRSAAPGQSSD